MSVLCYSFTQLQSWLLANVSQITSSVIDYKIPNMQSACHAVYIQRGKLFNNSYSASKLSVYSTKYTPCTETDRQWQSRLRRAGHQIRNVPVTLQGPWTCYGHPTLPHCNSWCRRLKRCNTIRLFAIRSWRLAQCRCRRDAESASWWCWGRHCITHWLLRCLQPSLRVTHLLCVIATTMRCGFS